MACAWLSQGTRRAEGVDRGRLVRSQGVACSGRECEHHHGGGRTRIPLLVCCPPSFAPHPAGQGPDGPAAWGDRSLSDAPRCLGGQFRVAPALDGIEDVVLAGRSRFWHLAVPQPGVTTTIPGGRRHRAGSAPAAASRSTSGAVRRSCVASGAARASGATCIGREPTGATASPGAARRPRGRRAAVGAGGPARAARSVPLDT